MAEGFFTPMKKHFWLRKILLRKLFRKTLGGFFHGLPLTCLLIAKNVNIIRTFKDKGTKIQGVCPQGTSSLRLTDAVPRRVETPAVAWSPHHSPGCCWSGRGCPTPGLATDVVGIR